MTVGNRFFGKPVCPQWLDRYRAGEVSDPDGPPCLFDPPEAEKTCLDCEYYCKGHCEIGGNHYPVSPDDEACEDWEGEE